MPGILGLGDDDGWLGEDAGLLISLGEGDSLNFFSMGCAAGDKASAGLTFKPPISGLYIVGLSMGCSESGDDRLLRF